MTVRICVENLSMVTWNVLYGHCLKRLRWKLYNVYCNLRFSLLWVVIHWLKQIPFSQWICYLHAFKKKKNTLHIFLYQQNFLRSILRSRTLVHFVRRYISWCSLFYRIIFHSLNKGYRLNCDSFPFFCVVFPFPFMHVFVHLLLFLLVSDNATDPCIWSLLC